MTQLVERGAFRMDVGSVLGTEYQTQHIRAIAVGMLCSSPVSAQGSPRILHANNP